jgi:hypothetical protein
MQKFYTKPKIARRCCEILKEHVNIDRKNDLIIEPSAGDGAFIPSSKKLCNSTIFIDIKPDNMGYSKEGKLKAFDIDDKSIKRY